MAEAVEATNSKVFEPTRYLTKLGSSDYLEVKWRLVWFRNDYPNGTIDTEPIEVGSDRAVFKVIIENGEGGRATGIGSETKADFKDFIEKAETKAIGRALAALGYGTQFSYEFEDGASQGRPVDAPVSRNGGAPYAPAGGGPAATERQIGYVTSLLKNKGMTDAQAKQFLDERYPEGLKRSEATPLIEELKSAEFVSPFERGGSNLDSDGKPKSDVTAFWERAKELGINNMNELKETLGEGLVEHAGGDFKKLLKILNDKATSDELEVPF